MYWLIAFQILTSYQTQYGRRPDVIYNVVRGYVVWLGFFDKIYTYIYICIYVRCMIVRHLVNLWQLEKIISLLIFRKVLLSLFYRFCGKRLYISTRRQRAHNWMGFELIWFDLILFCFSFSITVFIFWIMVPICSPSWKL